VYLARKQGSQTVMVDASSTSTLGAGVSDGVQAGADKRGQRNDKAGCELDDDDKAWRAESRWLRPAPSSRASQGSSCQPEPGLQTLGQSPISKRWRQARSDQANEELEEQVEVKAYQNVELEGEYFNRKRRAAEKVAQRKAVEEAAERQRCAEHQREFAAQEQRETEAQAQRQAQLAAAAAMPWSGGQVEQQKQDLLVNQRVGFSQLGFGEAPTAPRTEHSTPAQLSELKGIASRPAVVDAERSRCCSTSGGSPAQTEDGLKEAILVAAQEAAMVSLTLNSPSR